jgi:hypothetical protein
MRRPKCPTMSIVRPERNGVPSVSAPQRHAVPLRRPLMRKPGLPYDGVDAVAADQHVGLDVRSRHTAGAVHELGPHAVRLLAEARQMVAGVHALGAQAFAHRAVEDAQQLAAVDGELRPAVPGGEAARLAPDPLPVCGVVSELCGWDPYSVQLVEQAKLRKLAGRVREHVDADPKLFHARRRLVHVDVMEARVVQRQGERHAADAAAHDRHAHGVRRPAAFWIPFFTGHHAIPFIPVVVTAMVVQGIPSKRAKLQLEIQALRWGWKRAKFVLSHSFDTTW